MSEQVPKHEAVYRHVKGSYIDDQPAGQALPTERTLADECGVTRATVRHALARLEADGLVNRLQGAGTFTLGPTIAKSFKLTSFSDDIRLRGMEPSSTVLSAEVRPLPPDAARHLALPTDAPGARIERLRLANAVPMCLEVVWLNAEDVPGLVERDLSGSLYEAMAEYGLRLARAEQVIRATMTTPREAELLASEPGAPALEVMRNALDPRSRPIEYTRTLYRHDRFEVRFSVRAE